MRKYNIKVKVVILTILSVCVVAMNSYAHSGRTDSNGGHKDNKNKSGLGSYHYHCGGHPAHLHPNGVCPYSSGSSAGQSSTSSSSKSSISNSSTSRKSSTNNSSASNKSGISNSSANNKSDISNSQSSSKSSTGNSAASSKNSTSSAPSSEQGSTGSSTSDSSSKTQLLYQIRLMSHQYK